MTNRVAIVGASGKLGTIVRAVVEAEPGFEVHALLGSRSELAELEGADVVVDVSTPASSVDVVRAAVERGIPILIGTSGWSSERIALVRPLVAASGSPAVFIPNFSLGSVIGTALAAAAASFFSSIEIVETHSNMKIDSPSGTAVRTAELMMEARGETGPVEAPHVDQRARGQQVASIPIHSLRLQGVAARQQVILGAPGETLTIAHDTTTPAAAYGPGISLALRETMRARGVIVGLDSFLDIGLRGGGAATPAGAAGDTDEGAVPGASPA